MIGLQRRQVFRLLRGLKQDGAASLLSKCRGRTEQRAATRSSPHSGVVDRAGAVIPFWSHVRGGEAVRASRLFGVPRPCAMDDRGRPVVDRRHRPPSPHQPRRRRECLGELVQIDGSEHAWFEDRAGGARCWRSSTTLLAG